jgi:hypothetical protein
MPDFYDSASQRFPAGAEYVALYGDGDYKAPASMARRFPHVRRITVLGDYATCGIADWEAGNAVFRGGTLRAWIEGRRRMNCLARVYCDRGNAEEALQQAAGMPNVRWWISTLDGNPHWTAGELALDLAQNWHAPIAPDILWGVQFAGGMTADYDTSTLFGAW